MSIVLNGAPHDGAADRRRPGAAAPPHAGAARGRGRRQPHGRPAGAMGPDAARSDGDVVDVVTAVQGG